MRGARRPGTSWHAAVVGTIALAPIDRQAARPNRSTVDRRGVEPRPPACDAGVLPLDQQPIVPESSSEGAVVPEGVEPPFPVCKTGVVAAGPRDECSRTGGSRTHRHQTLSLAAMPIRVPCAVEK